MTDIPRSTQAGRGQLSGPASTPRQVRAVILRIDEPMPGRLRLSAPGSPDWSMVVRTPHELARAVAQAFTEEQIAAYTRWRGEEVVRHPVRRRSRERCDVHDPREWALTADGRWRAPGGNRYREDTDTVRRVMEARARMGLPVRPDVEPRGMMGTTS